MMESQDVLQGARVRGEWQGTRRVYKAWILLSGVLALFWTASLIARADTPDEQYEFAAGLYNQKLYSLAAEKLREFIATNPAHPKAVFASYQLGAALYRATGENEHPDYAAVAAAYERALQKPAPAPQIATAARFELGDADFNLKRYEAAIKVLSEYLKSVPAPEKENAAWAQYWIAQSYAELGKSAEARAAHQKVVTQYADNRDVAPYSQLALGILAADAGDNKAAVSAFKNLLQRYPQSELATETQLRLGDAFLADKNYGEAQAAYRALANDPKAGDYKSDALRGLADATFAAGDFAGAATQYAQVLALLKPDDEGRVAVQLQLGNSLYNAQKYDEAVKAYAPLLQSADANTAAPANYFSAVSLQALKRPVEAAPLFRKVVESFPQHALASKAALRLGDAYADAKDNERAVAAYKNVIAKYPQSEAAREARATLTEIEKAAAATHLAAVRAAYDDKDWSRAAQLAEALLAKKPAAPVAENALYLLADAKRQAGDASGAAQYFRRQIVEYPQGALTNEARLGLAWALLDAKQWSAAEAAARAGVTAVANDPKASELRDRLQLALGEALLRGDKATEAATVFARAETSTNKELAAQGAYGAALSAERAKQWSNAAAQWSAYAQAATEPATKAKAFLREGLAWRDARNAGNALAAFDRAIAADPKSDEAARALYESAWLARDQKKSEDETARWTRLVNEFPDSKYAAEAYFQQGEVLYAAKSYPEAAAVYRRVTEKFPQSEAAPLAWYKLGSALYNAQNWAEAASAFDKAASAQKEFSLESSFWAGESLRRAGKPAEAKTRYATFLQGLNALPGTSTRIKELSAFAPRAQLGMGLAFAAANDWPHAIATYQQGLGAARGATAAELNYRLGEALAQQNKWKEAAEQFLKVGISFPESEWASAAQWNAAQAMEKSDNAAGAMTIYKALAGQQPASEFAQRAQERLTALGAN